MERPNPPSQHPEVIGNDAKMMASFAELEKEGLTPFALGPIYVYAGVQEDIVRRFASEQPKQVRHYDVKEGVGYIPRDYTLNVRGMVLEFNHPVLTYCKEWNFLVNVLDSQSYMHFKKWMLAQQFANRLERKFFVPRLFAPPVLDPLALEAKGVSIPVSLDVYSVSRMRGVLYPKDIGLPKEQAKRSIEFVHRPPEEDTIKLGSAALKLLREV